MHSHTVRPMLQILSLAIAPYRIYACRHHGGLAFIIMFDVRKLSLGEGE